MRPSPSSRSFLALEREVGQDVEKQRLGCCELEICASPLDLEQLIAKQSLRDPHRRELGSWCTRSDTVCLVGLVGGSL